MKTEDLDRLEAAALKQTGLEFGTTIPVMPGVLRELVRGYRQTMTSTDKPSQEEHARNLP